MCCMSHHLDGVIDFSVGVGGGVARCTDAHPALRPPLHLPPQATFLVLQFSDAVLKSTDESRQLGRGDDRQDGTAGMAGRGGNMQDGRAGMGTATYKMEEQISE